MSSKLEKDLLAICALAICLIIIISFLSSSVLRIILGLPFIVFFPGYTAAAALFPQKESLGKMERVILSFGLSIIVVSLLGLALNYMPWGLGLYSIVLSITVFILATSAIGWYRRRILQAGRPLPSDSNLKCSWWTHLSSWEKLLSLVMVVAIFGVVGTLTWALVTPRNAEKYNEFYILGLDLTNSNYPKVLNVGEEGKVILGIVNHKRENRLSYRVEIVIDGENNSTVGPLWLNDGEQWQSEVGFTPRKVGEGQKVEFLLYENGEQEPYDSVYLWIDVK